MQEEELLTVMEAAESIGVTISAIRNATLQGRLPFTMKWGRKLISRADLAAYKARTQPEGAPLSAGRPKGSKNVDKQAEALAVENKPEEESS